MSIRRHINFCAANMVMARVLLGHVAAAGEPFQLFFTPEELESELLRAGFHRVEQLD
jgi:hypothetical protein